MDSKNLENILTRLDSKTLFIIITMCLIINNYFINEFIYSDDILYDALDDQLSIDRITTIVYLINKLKWIGYVIIPVILLVKTYVISFCIEIGAIFKGYTVSVKKIFHAVLLAETAYLAGQIIRTAIIYFSDFDSINEIQYFYPFSLFSFFNSCNLAEWLIYPLQMINLFVIMYFLLLAYGLYLILRKNFTEMLSFAFRTYGTCLLIWILLVMFINVNIL